MEKGDEGDEERENKGVSWRSEGGGKFFQDATWTSKGRRGSEGCRASLETLVVASFPSVTSSRS